MPRPCKQRRICALPGCCRFGPREPDHTPETLTMTLDEYEALRLIDGIRDAEALGIEDERKREENYKTALKSCRAEELVKMIKTINARKRSRAAISLDLERDQVKAFIRERIGEE